MWRNIRKLQGHTLQTLDRRKPFDVTRVTDSHVIVRPHVHNLERPIKREVFEGAWKELQRQGKLSFVDIKRKYSDYNPTYVSAILATFPGVAYRTRPIRLLYNG